MENIGVIVLLVFLFIVAAVIYVIVNYMRTTCTKCKTKFKREDLAEWMEISRQPLDSGSIQATVRFKFICPNCKNVKEYNKNFMIVTKDSSGRLKSHNLDHLVDKFLGEIYN